MDKQIITFSANEQNLVRIGGEYHYSSNKVSYIGAHFDLGANWDGFDSVRAVWFTDRINGISTVLDGEGNCTVPTEVLKKKDRVFVNLVGSIVSNGELTDRLTTYPAVALVVDSKAKVDSTETAPVTPSQFEQFVSIVQDAVANIKDIVSTTLNADYTLTFVYSDGTSYTTPSIRGERGPQGADGADGTDGNGIASAVLNSNYTLTLTFTDGTSYTTPSIRGAQGPKGDPGDVSQAQLDAAVSDLKSDLNDIREHDRNLIAGYSPFILTLTLNDTAKFDSQHVGTTIFFNCTAGEKYVFSSQGTSNRNVWAFYPSMPSDGDETAYFFNTTDISVTAPITGVGLRYSLNSDSESFAKGCQIEVGEFPTAFEQQYIAIDEKARRDADYITDAFVDALEYDLTSVVIGQTASATTTGAYITDVGKYYNTVGDTFVVKQYAVKAGISYNLKGRVKLNITAALVAFDVDSSLENQQILIDVIETCGSTATDFDIDYTAPVDGYLYIASYGSNGELSVTQTTAYRSERLDDIENITDVLSEKMAETPYTIQNSSVGGLYIDASGVFKTVSDATRFKIFYIPVVAGKKYKITYDNYSLLATYGAVAFSTAIPAANGTSTVLVTGGTTAQDIDYTYTATANGYLCVARASGSQSDAYAFYQFGYVIETGAQKRSLKIQLFGDSITDDYWGDKRTWATILSEYMPEYDLTVINSAVGGSAIGYRGHSSGGRYADKTYNYVCDLMIDGTFDTTVDVVIVLVGTNNFAGSYPAIGLLGDVGVIHEDESGTGFSIYGSCQFIINRVSSTSDALLIFATPPQRYNAADAERSVNSLGEPINNMGYTLRQLSDALADCCQFNGIPCVNLNASLGWNRTNVSNFTTDGLHPNNVGDTWIAQIMSSEIKRHCH